MGAGDVIIHLVVSSLFRNGTEAGIIARYAVTSNSDMISQVEKRWKVSIGLCPQEFVELCYVM